MCRQMAYCTLLCYHVHFVANLPKQTYTNLCIMPTPQAATLLSLAITSAYKWPEPYRFTCMRCYAFTQISDEKFAMSGF